MSETEEFKLNDNIIKHPLDPVERYQLQMGWINKMFLQGHYFLGMYPFIQLIGDIDTWLEDVSRMKLPADPRTKFVIPPCLTKEWTDKINQIWYGHVYLYQILSSHLEVLEEKIAYRKPEFHEQDERYLEMPALMHLNPKSKTRNDQDPRVLIQEPVRFDIAWDGYDVDQLTDVVKFRWDYIDGSVPMFTSDEEVMTSEAYVMEISRDAYHKMIKILTVEMSPYKHKVYNQITNILYSYRYLSELNRMIKGTSSDEGYTVEFD